MGSRIPRSPPARAGLIQSWWFGTGRTHSPFEDSRVRPPQHLVKLVKSFASRGFAVVRIEGEASLYGLAVFEGRTSLDAA